ncbi:hypothetical protein G6F50_017614 [Rhizopus delemar]|uniref:Uncharacterized protein n=1 Tax=Rhizopus delemar TaxID=936053 RepID=A0A9P7BZI3_9FUNG|nr:hypothetical protein G6F50_017614 [Rhizopus delemar]
MIATSMSGKATRASAYDPATSSTAVAGTGVIDASAARQIPSRCWLTSMPINRSNCSIGASANKRSPSPHPRSSTRRAPTSSM